MAEHLTIVLDAGHGGGESGAEGHGIREEAANQVVVDALAAILRAEGHSVVQAPRVGVTARGEWSAEKGADVFVSVHHDSSDNSGARGTHGFYHNEQAVNGRRLATCLAEEVHAEFGVPFSYGAPSSDWFGKTLGVLRGGDNWRVTGAACLVEMMFVSNDEDAAIVKSDGYARRAGLALARGIHRYAGLPAPSGSGGGTSKPAEFEEARTWVRGLGISDGSDPGAPATREQVWTMLRRLYGRLGGQPTNG